MVDRNGHFTDEDLAVFADSPHGLESSADASAHLRRCRACSSAYLDLLRLAASSPNPERESANAVPARSSARAWRLGLRLAVPAFAVLAIAFLSRVDLREPAPTDLQPLRSMIIESPVDGLLVREQLDSPLATDTPRGFDAQSSSPLLNEIARRSNEGATTPEEDYLLAVNMLLQRSPDNARVFVQRAADRAPANPDAQLLLAALALRDGNVEEGLARLVDLQASSPDDGLFLFDLAWAESVTGRVQSARAHYQQLLEQPISSILRERTNRALASLDD